MSILALSKRILLLLIFLIALALIAAYLFFSSSKQQKYQEEISAPTISVPIEESRRPASEQQEPLAEEDQERLAAIEPAAGSNSDYAPAETEADARPPRTLSSRAPVTRAYRPPSPPTYSVAEPVTEPASPIVNAIPYSLDKYSIELGADQQLELPGFPGELRVWIGASGNQANFPASFTSDSTTIPAEGAYATIEPFAPAFNIEPATTQCITIHPSGSEVRFQLTPKKTGSYHVGADVFLYNNAECSGSPIPKTAATLEVTVAVNTTGFLSGKGVELWHIFWEGILEFWTTLVALGFALALFLIRGKLKQWFNFDSQ